MKLIAPSPWLISVALLVVTAAVSDAAAQSAPPGCPTANPSQSCRIEAVIGRGVAAKGFTPSSQVKFEIHESVGGPLILGPVTRRTDSSGFTQVDAPNLHLALGNHVVVTDVATQIKKELKVAHIRINKIDPAGDFIYGKASPNDRVTVTLTQPTAQLVTDADQSGTWRAFFHEKGVDMTSQTQIFASVNDADGDQTGTFPPPGCPPNSPDDCRVTASIDNDYIAASGSRHNQVSLEVFSPEGQRQYGPTTVPTDIYGQTDVFLLGFDNGIDLVPGSRVVMIDLATSTVKTLVLDPLSIDTVQPDSNLVTGQAPRDERVELRVAGGGPAFSGDTAIASEPNRTWTADYAAIGYDVTPLDWFLAGDLDDDGDVTLAERGAPLASCQPSANTICGTAGPDTVRAGEASAKRALAVSPASPRGLKIEAGPGDDTSFLTVGEQTGNVTVDLGSGGDRALVIPPDGSVPVQITIQGGKGNEVVALPTRTGELVVNVLGGRGHDLVGTRKLGGARAFLGHYRLAGRRGDDTLTAGDGDDLLIGGRGNDKLAGGAGRDEMHGGPGRDVCFKGRGDLIRSCDVVRKASDA
jgi:Ca2+-binding RTX toxin-like protein